MTPQIRAAEEHDAAAIAEIYAPYVAHTAISFESEPPSAKVMSQRIAGTLKTHPWLVAVWDGRIVGYAYAGKHRDRPGYRWTTDTTIYVDSSIHQRGVGRALYSQLIDILQQQGFRSAFAEIVLPNPASVRLHVSLGFSAIGVHENIGLAQRMACHRLLASRLSRADALAKRSCLVRFIPKNASVFRRAQR